MIKTEEFTGYEIEEVEIGREYVLGQLMTGEEDYQKTMQDGCIIMQDDGDEDGKCVVFEVITRNDADYYNNTVKVTDIY